MGVVGIVAFGDDSVFVDHGQEALSPDVRERDHELHGVGGAPTGDGGGDEGRVDQGIDPAVYTVERDVEARRGVLGPGVGYDDGDADGGLFQTLRRAYIDDLDFQSA